MSKAKPTYLIDKITMSMGAQEPWPKDVKLYQPHDVEQILLHDNANCLAVQAFLKMCKLNYELVYKANAEAMSPTGKVPFIKCGAFVVSELEGIVQFADSRGISLSSNLDADAKSDMRAYMSLIHTVLENAELYVCWLDEETYNEITRVRHGSVYPWPLNHIQNWSKYQSVAKSLKVYKWYNKTLNDVYQEVENCCQALSDRLGDSKYFFGDSPTELDALVFGHLFTIITTPLTKNGFADIAKKFPLLLNLLKNIESEYFDPEKQ